MKKGINKVTLVGHVGDEPKVNNINDTTKVARFPLATNEIFVDKNGVEVQKTEWHTVVAWNKRAGIIEEYVKKGDALYVEGKIQTSNWEDKDGNKRKSIEILCDDFLFLSPRNRKAREEE
jgi:single-strand DNA-binding protein